jgi:hypothetical protein
MKKIRLSVLESPQIQLADPVSSSYSAQRWSTKPCNSDDLGEFRPCYTLTWLCTLMLCVWFSKK